MKVIRIADPTVKGGTVLLIENNTDRQCRICMRLYKKGYQPLFTNTLAEARKYLKSSAIDAVILNERLPDGSGVDFVREIHKSNASTLACVPVMLLTKEYTGDKITEACENGCADCQHADSDAGVICAAVTAMLHKSGAPYIGNTAKSRTKTGWINRRRKTSGKPGGP